MKKILLLFTILFLLPACRQTCQEEDTSTICEPENIPKATAILWVDKNAAPMKGAQDGGPSLRTVKAKVTIDSLGQVNLHSFVKKQEPIVEEYLQYRLQEFRITPMYLDSGYIHPGTQYVQLRYVPGKVGNKDAFKKLKLTKI
ncbi:MAG: DUF4891 domain-containing protein [Bacteroides sp.]